MYKHILWLEANAEQNHLQHAISGDKTGMEDDIENIQLASGLDDSIEGGSAATELSPITPTRRSTPQVGASKLFF